MSAPFSLNDVPSIQEEERARINSGRFIRFSWSIHLPKWVMYGLLDKLPPDVLMVAASFEISRNTHSLVFWSNYFPERQPHLEIEELSVTVNTETRSVTLNRWNAETRALEEVSWPVL